MGVYYGHAKDCEKINKIPKLQKGTSSEILQAMDMKSNRGIPQVTGREAETSHFSQPLDVATVCLLLIFRLQHSLTQGR